MRTRLAAIRMALAASDIPGSSKFAAQEGLFAMMPFAPDAIAAMRESHGVYMDMSGRINIAGLNTGNIERFLDACRNREPALAGADQEAPVTSAASRA